MAVVYPAANDNWSTVANWMSNGIPYGQLPQSGDIVCANGKTVTIDMDLAAYTFDRLTTAATAPAAAGGGFTVGISNTINANITAGTTTCLTSTGTGTTLVINGEIKGGGSNYAYGISCTAACTVTVTGNVTGGSGAYTYGIYCTAACTVTITGNVTGGSGAYAYGISCTAACTVTITGNVTGGSSNYAYGISCITQTSYVTIRGIITTQTPPIAQIQSLNGTIVLYFAGIIISKGNMMPFNVQQFILLSSGSTMWTVKTELNTDKSIYTADYAPLGNPVATDTRDGVIYGPVGELTGTLKVPPPAAVLLGVPTDNVVGTLAPASASDVWDHLLTGISVAGSIGKLIKDNLDVPVSSITGITPAQIWDYLLTAIITPGSIGQLLKDDIDAKISTRATPADITTSLTAFGVSTLTVAQVWDYLTATILTPGSIGKLLVDNIDTKLSDLPTLFWSKVIDGTYTADKVLKIMASILAGKTVIVDTGNNTATVTFRNLDDTGDVVKANMNNSERITMTLTP